jgi:hypothetical protein
MGVVILVLVFVGPWLLLGLDIALRVARDPAQWRADVKLAQHVNEVVGSGGSEWSRIRSRGY